MSDRRTTSRTSPKRAKAASSRRTGRQAVARARSGAAVTDELAEQLADEAEAGYDLSRGRRVGRPSLGGRKGTSPRVNFRTTPALHERASRRAKREGKTISQLAREALERYVA